MQPEEVRTPAQARAIVEERGLTHVKVGVFDNDGILRGKLIDRAKFFSALEKGLGFCDVVLGWDSNDQQYDNVTFTGWHTAFPDAPVRLLPETCRSLPLEGSVEAAYRAEIDAAEDPVAKLAEIEQRLEQLRSPFRTAEAFLVEEIIDPRDTRPLLCEFANLAAPLRQVGLSAFTMRP